MTKPINPTLNSVNKLVRSLGELSPRGEVLASVCRSLAEQLDVATGSHTGTQSMALPNLAKQLQASMTDLLSLHPAEDTFLGFLNSDDESLTTEEEYATAMAEEASSRLIHGAA
jgi:hypothetical protein